jgi:hypothetical protein
MMIQSLPALTDVIGIIEVKRIGALPVVSLSQTKAIRSIVKY